MRGARVPYQNPMISYCKTAPDQICRRAPNGRPCQAISRQKSAGRKCAEESAAFDYQEFWIIRNLKTLRMATFPHPQCLLA